MAGRNQHVQDTAVAERRLRPIYEWLDSGNPKKALQETEKVLRKTPNLQCAKALKALSLLQLGREQECVIILNTLTADTPSDNSTLQAMTICYRDLGQLDRVCQLYEKAIQTDPTNEELHTHLFMSYVRTSNFKLQQQSAMALYKMKPKNPYYFWAVMSVVLQATRGQDSAKRSVLLSLAERMIDKLINEGKLEAEQEVQLYLMVLQLQGKYEDVLKVMDGPLGAKLMSGSTDAVRIECLVKLQRWSELNLLCTDLLTANMDRWDIWNYYLTSIFELSKTIPTSNHHSNHISSSSPSHDDPIDSIEKAHEFICSIIETISGDNLFKSSSSYQLRGPYLARFELCARLHSAGKDFAPILGDIFELFVEYFRLFGHKSCCVSDLKVYLYLLSKERRLDLAGRLLKDVGISATTLPQTEKQMQRHICSLQLSRLCGSHISLDVEYLRALIAALVLHYENGERKFSLEKLPTDQAIADAYALLAAHSLYDLSIANHTSTGLIAALVLLENLLKSSPSNFHAKLLCVRIYHLVGGAEGAQKWYESLDAKHLQMDSLGFVHCGRMHVSGALGLTAAIYDSTLKFFSTNYRDSIDHLTFSYKFGSFLKLEEFMDFRERLNNSLHYTLTAIDRMLLEMLLCHNLKSLGIIDASPKNNNIDWDALRDNNDYNVYVSWDPDRISPEIDPNKSVLFEQDRDLARIRAGILCCVSSSLDLLKNSTEHREQSAKTLSEVFTDWLVHFRAIETKKYPPRVDSLSHPLPSRLSQQLLIPSKPVISFLVQLVLSAAQKTGISPHRAETDLENVTKLLEEMSARVQSVVQEQTDSEDCLLTRRTSLEFVVNFIELLSVSCILCAVCWELLRPSKSTTTGRKGKKKPPQNSGEAPQSPSSTTNTKSELSSCISVLHRCCTVVDQTLGNWKPPTAPGDLAERLASLAITTTNTSAPETQDNVLKHIRNSHATAISDLKTVLANKIKLLNTLTC